jgi:uncharacterized protein YaaW (UPF0174 family)
MDELRTALELANEEELKDLTEILFHRGLNPLDYIHAPDPVKVQSQDHKVWLDALEERFRFLAADGITVLRGQANRISYRQVLIQVCRYLKLPYSPSLSTTDLEAEIFLNLLNRAWNQLPPSEQRILSRRIQNSSDQSTLTQSFSTNFQHDSLRLLLEGGSALAVSSVVRPVLLQQIAQQFAAHFAAREAAKQTVLYGGKASLQLKSQVALKTAGRGMALSAARYGAVRSVFALVGSALWVWFLADLGWRAIATNYGRVIPIVFALAQIRLTRTEYFNLA